MKCELCRELVSADLDGELTPLEHDAMHAHVRDCAACGAFAQQAGDLHRSTRVAPAEQVPDLSAAILRGAPEPSPARRRGGDRPLVAFLRYALGVVAVTQLVLALPELFIRATGGTDVHSARHLGGWDLAFAVGLLWAGVQPWRARGLLPMAVALAGVMVVTAGIDVSSGQAAGLAESSHLLEITGLVLLWQLARTQPAGEAPGGRGRGLGPVDHGGRPTLRLAPRAPGSSTTASSTDRELAA